MADQLKLASEHPFPYGYPGLVCYIRQYGTELTQLRTRDEAREAVRRAIEGNGRILAVWPGQYRSDLFLIDDLPALAQAIKA